MTKKVNKGARKVFDKKTYVNLRTIHGTAKILRTHDYSSFPSTPTVGWPMREEMHPLTAYSFKRINYYSPAYNSDGKIVAYNMAPDQLHTPDISYLEWLRQRAINKALETFMDGKQQLAADFAERQSTIDMIANRSVQALNVLRHVKKGNLRKAVKVLNGGKEPRSRKAAALQLEFSYGWAPLVGSLYDICQKEFPPDPEIYISERFSQPYNFDGDNMSTEGKCSGSCSFVAIMHMPLTASAAKLGLINPVSVAWEVVPFSFIVDWFIPISTYLQSFDLLAGYYIKDKSSSISYKLTQRNSQTDGSGIFQRSRMIQRETHTDLSFRPFISNPLSTRRAINALSLIRVLRKD